MFFVPISISIYIFGIYLILVFSNCNAIQSTDCHVRYFSKLYIYLSISFNFASYTHIWLLKASFLYTQIDFESVKHLSKLSTHLMLCHYSLIVSELFTLKNGPVIVGQNTNKNFNLPHRFV